MGRHPVRILHLDDSPLDAQLVELALDIAREEFPSTLLYVGTRKEYLDALVRRDFEIILSDWRMPGYTGDDALADARRLCPEIPFIMVTGELGEDRAIETLHRGATDYVLKGNMIRLVPAIKRALAEAETSRKRKEAEQERERLLLEVQRGRSELLAVIQAMHGGVMVFDTRGKVVLINESQAAMLGSRDRGKVDRHLSFFTETFEFYTERGDLVPVDDWPLSHVMRGETMMNRELRGKRRDTGQEWYFSFSGQPVRDAAGKQILSVLVTRDITERKLIEDALIRAHQRTSEILESIQDAFYAVDKDLNVTYVNRKAEEILRRGRADLLGKNVWEAFPEAVGGESYHAFQRAQRDRVAVHYETFSPVLKTWIESSLYPTAGGGISIFFRDITGRKQADEALRLSQEKFAAAFADNPAAIVLSRLKDGTYQEVNNTWVAMTGYSREEAVGRTSLEVGIWPSDEDRRRFVDELRERGFLQGREQEFIRKTGERFVAQLSATVLRIGEEKMVLSTLVDITHVRCR